MRQWLSLTSSSVAQGGESNLPRCGAKAAPLRRLQRMQGASSPSVANAPFQQGACQGGPPSRPVNPLCLHPQVEQTWAPFYPIIPATPADYTNLPCTYRASEGAPPMQGTFSLSLPGFNYDGQYWVPVGGTRFTTFTILCSTPSPPPPPPRCGQGWPLCCSA